MECRSQPAYHLGIYAGNCVAIRLSSGNKKCQIHCRLRPGFHFFFNALCNAGNGIGCGMKISIVIILTNATAGNGNDLEGPDTAFFKSNSKPMLLTASHKRPCFNSFMESFFLLFQVLPVTAMSFLDACDYLKSTILTNAVSIIS